MHNPICYSKLRYSRVAWVYIEPTVQLQVVSGTNAAVVIVHMRLQPTLLVQLHLLHVLHL